MKSKLLIILLALILLPVFVQAAEQKSNSAVTPESRDNWWTLRNEAVNERVKQGNVDLLMIGDSITQGWENAGKTVWDKYYGHRNAVNMGFNGDRTQHVLWRLEHGHLEGISPKLAVVMIGTNNSNRDDNTAEEISEGIIAICKKIREKCPKTKILLLAIFPRGPEPSPQREKNAKASLLASKIAANKMIYYMNINNKFLIDKKFLSMKIMPDYLHPNEEGYKIWAAAVEPKVAELIGDKQVK